MKRIVKYISVDRYYSDFTETYIGSTQEEIDNIQQETEDAIAQYHASLSLIYKTEIIFDDTFQFGTDIVSNSDKEEFKL